MSRRRQEAKKKKIDLQEDMLNLSMMIKGTMFPMQAEDLMHSAPILREVGANVTEFSQFMVSRISEYPVKALPGLVVLNFVYLFISHKIGSSTLGWKLLDPESKYHELRAELDSFKEESKYWAYLDNLLETQYAPTIIVKG